MSLSGALIWGMTDGAVYLWTVPMFHCNGWCYTWALAARCGTNICLRKVTAKAVYEAIAKYKVTHFCAAPVVLNTILNAPPEDTILPLPHVVRVSTGGAPPPPSVLSGMSERGFGVTHVYGLSEVYGPAVYCSWKPEWESLPPETQARLHARQGVRYIGLEYLDVVNAKTMQPVPADGKTVGEVVMRGNAVMKGYLKNPKANEEAFANGWFHSGDLAVKHQDGYIEIKARADKKWGESPCAFVTLKPGVDKSNEQRMIEDVLKFSRAKMPAYWVPKSVVFGALPKTATGKIQKHLLRAKAKEMGPVKISKL
ncbi:Acetate/butyrate--CoA ligase AAE7, peroxisomal [Glycine max]|nr:Acetate/butyrate--CoA ligase AAE7, peroxisomal [Glycine max]